MGTPLIIPFSRDFDDQRSFPPASANSPTLWDIWREIEPEKRAAGRAPATLSEHETAIRKIEEVCRKVSGKVPDSRKKYRTIHPVLFSDPPLVREFTRESLVQIVQAWNAGGLSRDTIRKRFSTLKLLLREAADQGLIEKMPRFPPLPSGRVISGFAGAVSIAEVDALYRAAEAAEWPMIRSKSLRERFWWLSPALWWRSWLVLWWCYGLRTQDVAAVKSGFAGLLWQHLRKESACPVPGVKATAPHGWLFLVPAKTQRTKGQPVIAPLHPVIWRHVSLFRGLDPERVFPNGRSHKLFYGAWQKICRAAGVEANVTIAGSETGRQGNQRSIRKAAANNWPEGLGEWITGHADLGVHARHYKNVADQLVSAIEDLPLPASFSDESLLPRRQAEMFD